MKQRLNNFGQWLLKSLLFVGSISLVISFACYFIYGGKLISDGSIPIEGLLSCLAIPFFLIGVVGMFYIITETEKEMEE